MSLIKDFPYSGSTDIESHDRCAMDNGNTINTTDISSGYNFNSFNDDINNLLTPSTSLLVIIHLVASTCIYTITS